MRSCTDFLLSNRLRISSGPILICNETTYTFNLTLLHMYQEHLHGIGDVKCSKGRQENYVHSDQKKTMCQFQQQIPVINE